MGFFIGMGDVESPQIPAPCAYHEGEGWGAWGFYGLGDAQSPQIPAPHTYHKGEGWVLGFLWPG